MFLNKAYYTFKRIIPRVLQIQLRRYMIQRKLALHKDTWPIDPNASKMLGVWNSGNATGNSVDMTQGSSGDMTRIRQNSVSCHQNSDIGEPKREPKKQLDSPELSMVSPQLFPQLWAEGKKFALVLTHDVETAEGLDRCLPIADMEERLGFRSSFNFVPGDYDVPKSLRQTLTDRGFEIGIHGMHHGENPFQSAATFRKQSTEINRYLKEWNAVGFRSPSMYHDLDLLHHLDIEYDASTFDTDPFEPQPDGMGTIFPFRVPGNGRRKGYIELPYTLPQDFLLFILMQERTIDIWKMKLDWIVEHGGMALFIAHPNYMNFGKTSHYEEYPARYYEEFLAYIKLKYEGQYWNALPKEVAHFWNRKDEKKDMETHVPVVKKQKIWIDLDNSPHVPFFKPIIEDLHQNGYSTLLTARDCFQVCGLADLMKLDYKKIGRHYGKNVLMKVAGLLIRSSQLMPSVLNEKPDIAVSHGSRSQVLISSLLNIPTVVIADYEYTQTVARPTYVIVPEMIPDSSVKGYTKAVLKYPGIKEDVYVPDFKPDPSILQDLGIQEDELLVTIRPPATEAHYHNPESERLFEETLNFLGEQENVRMVILPRNEKKQTAWVKSNWSALCDSRKIIIPEHVVDGLNLIWHSDLVISGGGTMNREAAALEVPVYSIFRGKIGAVDRYLSENGRLVLLETVEDVRKKIILNKRLRSDKIDNSNRKALAKIVEHIETILKEVK